MLDGLSPCVIVSNTLPGTDFFGLDWWTILMVARAVGASHRRWLTTLAEVASILAALAAVVFAVVEVIWR